MSLNMVHFHLILMCPLEDISLFIRGEMECLHLGILTCGETNSRKSMDYIIQQYSLLDNCIKACRCTKMVMVIEEKRFLLKME